MEETVSEIKHNAANSEPSGNQTTHKGLRFWLIIIALIASQFLAVLESFAFSTALPAVIADLHADQFIWVANAYAIPVAAVPPLSGCLAEVFGRRPVMLGSLFLFSIGSIIGGAAQSMNMLVIGRVFQGVGAGGIFSSTTIIVSDLVSLQERGLYGGLLGMSSALSSGIGPIIGGALAHSKTWRWLLYLNLPIAGIAAFLVVLFLSLPTPPGTMQEKLYKIDWLGNILVIGATTSCVISLTWAGEIYAWNSLQVLIPLCIGGVGLVIFLIYEVQWCTKPMIPRILISNRTSLSGYLQMFFCAFIIGNIVYYLPVYYQAVEGASPVASGVELFAISFTLAPISVVTGASVAISKRYRPQLWASWCLMTVGLALLSTVSRTTSRATSIGFQILIGFGAGMGYATSMFPVMAPLPVSENARALAFYTFLRSLSQVVWGISVGAAIFQNRLLKKLPSSFINQFQGASIAYAAIPQIASLPSPLQTEVQTAYAASLKTLWQMLIGFSSAGLIASLLMQKVTLNNELDSKWAVQEPNSQNEASEGSSSTCPHV
ncbi:hypothetical protein D9758_018849 [Tetrapyrgos nigripes]|uniref:Major facilitator superfamily (MFS) profile domain-containing protein n=1 Tax=Tetrapyrgos nigripes TaxID=182062 RepID=A0A8H5BAN5_9AGAR|nr:hypothetical protein D9758_018849 [Tetrapyrgos nigripes]